jgi:fatty-acyl-CoA synthase
MLGRLRAGRDQCGPARAKAGVRDGDLAAEGPEAAVVLRPGMTAKPAELADFLTGKVARWQVPENWTFVAEIPKTTVGKFDKKVLRARLADGDLEVERTS